MPRSWTKEQETAIQTTDKTVLLSAAAGSGKTATLTERLIRMITREDKPLDVSRILVVTFTRDAAEELRVRIAAALDEALAKDPQNKHLLRSSLLLPTAKIRTIDSFCNDLVKGHTETLGIKPHYRIPDSSETKLLTASILDEVIFDAYSGTYAPEGLDVSMLAECTVGSRNEKDLAALLADLYEKLCGYPDGLGILKKNAEEMEKSKHLPFFETPWGRVIQKEALSLLCDHIQGLCRALEGAVGDELFEAKLAPVLRALHTRLEQAKEAAKVSYGALRAALFAPLKEGNDPAASDDKLSREGYLAKLYRRRVLSDADAFKEKYLLWEEKDIPEAFEKNASLGKSIFLVLSEFERRFLEEKRARALCTYNDLERFAYKLLRDENGERTPLANELAASFDAVCIDEYQDVNDIQHLIFEAISTPTNRFMVGDIKQSIYYFRGAKPDIFSSLRRRLSSGEGNSNEAVLYLTRNFRSLPHLIRFNNGIFDFLFGRLGERIGYGEKDRLDAARTEPDTPQPLPEICYLHKPNGSLFGEWDILAIKIKALLENGKRADGSPIRPSDIAVLYRKSAVKRFEIASALARYGIPVSTEDTQNFFLFPEILLALCLIGTVCNPRRDVYLTGLLRSPLYGFSMEELLRIKRGERQEETCLYESLVRYTEENPDFKKGKTFLSDLCAFRAAAQNMPSDRLCDLLFRQSALYALADEAGKGRLHVLYDCARTFEANRFHGVFRFFNHLQELIEAGESLGAKRLLGDTNGVKIGTMHSSKGLEYPVTFIVDTASHAVNREPSLCFHPKLGVAAKIRDGSGLGNMKNPVRSAVICATEEDESDEEIRVLYVALTRACEQLYITGASNSRPSSISDEALLARTFPSPTVLRGAGTLTKILGAVGETSSLCRYTVLTQNDLEAPANQAEGGERREERPQEKTDVTALCERFRERFSFSYPQMAKSSLPGKISVSRLYPGFLDEAESPLSAEDKHAKNTDKSIEGKGAATVPFFLSGIEENPAAKAGTATHLFLQFCRFEALRSNGGDTVAAVKNELARLTREGFIHPADAERVRVEELAAFAESELLSRILNAKRVFREFRFNAMLPASLFSVENPERYGELEVFTQGVIDLLLENEDGSLCLCDYKTDRLERAMLQNEAEAQKFFSSRHGTQLFYYARAIERIFGKCPSRIEIFSLHAGKSFEITPIL